MSCAPGGDSVHSRPARFFVPCGPCPPPTEGVAITIPGKQQEARVNERIRVPQVRVIGDDGSQVGILSTRDALAMAQSKGLDLVEVAATSRPPVCRIMDYGKFKYEQNLRARKAKKNQHQMQLKEVKMRPKIEDHDYNFKLRHAREFLEERNKVKFTVTFRGREMAHQELGHKIIQAILTDLADIALVETPARQEGRTLSMVMTPKAGKPVEPKKATPEGKSSEQAPPTN
ncbi:MAG: translation initiation factor IF-3 [Candidatus Eisenbacteria bacterium]|uniref:Translation initiation factor IF-3 n=1 Tax=Eiseniibacteriota bacterium TaxID=2212470 RepID=A0A933S8L9_UNCEI|nr:translation initiation factor IF-3 [Candidatus Eisenbacteria bacterium]